MSKQLKQVTQDGNLTGDLSTEQLETILGFNSENKIESLEKHMLEQTQVEIPPIEAVKNGMYTRQIMIPKGTLLTGRVHKYPYVDIMVSGHIAIATPNGVRKLSGFNVCDGSPGRKRAGYALEDTYWMTVHQLDQWVDSDTDFIEHLTFFSMREYNVWRDRKDFVSMMVETGHTPEMIRRQSENLSDYLPYTELAAFTVKSSPIEGKGMFAEKSIDPGQLLGLARLNEFRTQFGRYVNHSAVPNAVVKWSEDQSGNIDMFAKTRIEKGEEILIDYRQALSLEGG